jgi:enterochelin esterase-like enzyme
MARQKIIIFAAMPIEKSTNILQDSMTLESVHLGRTVQVDFYLVGGGVDDVPGADAGTSTGDGMAGLSPETSLLLINDGQELGRMGLADILDDLYGRGRLAPLLCAGIHAGAGRKMEYGTASRPDYQGWGAQAGAYCRCVLEELIPAIRRKYGAPDFKEKAFAGFSLGALSALDIVWNYPQEFARAGLFSGSFWWRTKDKEDPAYDERRDRIMQGQVREGGYYPWLKFFFECGTEDEQEDRNKNGVIDSIDDTQDLIRELVGKGYDGQNDIRYLEIEGGRHDVGTWAQAMPEFLLWGWGR